MMFANTGPFSYSPRALSPEDLPQTRRVFQQDDLMGAPLQKNNISRPSGKAIYMQRKEYSESLNRQPDHFQVRVEHLFTCELDGEEMRTVDNCVTKLKSLDARGRLWPQEMIMEVQGGYLLLSDIETKVELESLPLSCIMQSKAVLDSCTYSSLLAVTVHERSKRFPQVLMFQCEEIGAELIKSDLDKAVQKGGVGVEPRRDQFDIRRNLENIIGQHAPGGFQQAGPRPVQRERTPPLLDHPPPQWGSREPEVTVPHSNLELRRNPEVTSQQAENLRNTDIFNHVINDLEIFLDKVYAAINAPLLQEDKRKKKKVFQKNKPKINGPADSMPPWEEYISCLQKIKYGLNLLSQLDGTLTNPTAPDYVHIFFSSLGMIVPRYPAHLPPTVLSPMLTESALQLLSQVVGPEEELLWRSLGDSWNIPRSRWTGNDVPPYNPEFYNGWQPPTLLPYQNGPMNRSNSQHLPSGRQGGQKSESQGYLPSVIQQQPEEPVTQSPWSSPQSTRSSEPPVYMRVIYDYMARNNQELSVLKGDVVEVIQKSRQWCLVRNTGNEEGNVPRSVLEPIENTRSMENVPQKIRGPVTLDISSTPAAVRAWLEYKGFSKITVNTLGVLSGKLLLGMTKDEIRTVCPEEGGKVFFQLQAVKSAIALASEPSALYNRRY